MVEPTLKEIKRHIKNLKNHKAICEVKITEELLKSIAVDLIKYIHHLVSQIWKQEIISKEWVLVLVAHA